MSEATEQDPSIEEILSSIRQIISDDDEVEGDVSASEESPVAAPVKETPVSEEDEVFELTQDMAESDDDDDDVGGDLPDVSFSADSADDVDINDDDEEIFTDVAASATVGAFSKLSQNVALANHSDNVTLEDIVKDMLRPMLREWIDMNMPQIVEVLVEKELEKLARHAKDS